MSVAVTEKFAGGRRFCRTVTACIKQSYHTTACIPECRKLKLSPLRIAEFCVEFGAIGAIGAVGAIGAIGALELWSCGVVQVLECRQFCRRVLYGTAVTVHTCRNIAELACGGLGGAMASGMYQA